MGTRGGRELFPVLSGFKWRWKTVNESDPAADQRLAGCQVRPGQSGSCVCVSLFCLTAVSLHLSIKSPEQEDSVTLVCNNIINCSGQ